MFLESNIRSSFACFVLSAIQTLEVLHLQLYYCEKINKLPYLRSWNKGMFGIDVC